MSGEYPASHYQQGPSRGGYGSAVAWAWVLLVGTCVLSLVPVLGFSSWIIGAATITIAIVLAIVAIAKGGTTHGVLLLLASLLFVPLFIFLAPIITSALFLESAELESTTTESMEETAERKGVPGWIEEIESGEKEN